MSFRPIGYTKEHPVGVVSCILIGMALSHYGFGFAALPFVNAKAKVAVGGDD